MKAAIAILVVGALTACSSPRMATHHHTTTTAPTTTAPTTTQGVTTAPSGAGPCKAAYIKATANHQGGGFAGNSHIGVILSNVSARACLLSGQPALSLVRGDGSVLPVSITPRFASQLVTVLLTPQLGNAAELGANWSNWCGPPPGPLRLRITLPDQAGAIDVPFINEFSPACIDATGPSVLSLLDAYG
jgi:hypothetical protein